VFTYQQSVFAELARVPHELIGKRQRHQFNDVYEQMERLASLSGLYQELAGDLIDGYISLNSHRLNQIMKVLTIVAVIFLPLSLLVGVYGMNFENMPELQARYGYYVLLTVMTLIGLGLLFLFRRLRWL
jgi:magnesium transporter